MTGIVYNPDPKGDQWYRYKGVEPPERFPHLTEDELAKIREEIAANHRCVWKQKGNIIFCEEGEYEHGRVLPSQTMIARDPDGNVLVEPSGMPRIVPLQPIMRKRRKLRQPAKSA